MSLLGEHEASRGLDDARLAQDAVVPEPRGDEEARALPGVRQRLAGLDRDLAIVAIVDDQRRLMEVLDERRAVELLERATDLRFDARARQRAGALVEPEQRAEAT